MMRYILSLILSLALTCSQASAGFLLNSYTFAKPAYSVTYLGSCSWSTGSTISCSIDLGVQSSWKEIFLVSATRGASARTLTAASTTIAGTAVTKCTTENTTATAAQACGFATVTATGSQTVTATYSSTLVSGSFSVYSVISRPNAGNNQTDAAGTTAAAATSCTVNATTINANGIWFGAIARAGTTSAFTSPATEDNDVATGSDRSAQSSRGIQGSSSTPSDTWSWITSNNAGCASWAFD